MYCVHGGCLKQQSAPLRMAVCYYSGWAIFLKWISARLFLIATGSVFSYRTAFCIEPVLSSGHAHQSANRPASQPGRSVSYSDRVCLVLDLDMLTFLRSVLDIGRTPVLFETSPSVHSLSGVLIINSSDSLSFLYIPCHSCTFLVIPVHSLSFLSPQVAYWYFYQTHRLQVYWNDVLRTNGNSIVPFFREQFFFSNARAATEVDQVSDRKSRLGSYSECSILYR